VPVVPSCLLEPAWVEFCALLDERRGGELPPFHPGHPLGCHRRRVPGRVVSGHVVAALVHGSGYERIATPGCSDRTIRRRLAEGAEAGLAGALHAAALRACDQVIGLELADVAVDGCHTKAPCGGERAGPSPVDRRKGGLKRSLASDGHGIPLGLASAPGNRHDSPLLAPTLAAASAQLDGVLPQDRACHLDAGYDSTVTRQLLDELGFDGQIARRGIPAPIQASTRWVVERTQCAARRSVVFPVQPGGIRREVPGSNGLPESERLRGQQHARKPGGRVQWSGTARRGDPRDMAKAGLPEA
jgi:Transposase DDE domain